jgi:peptidoglycan/xylan/chitin deacetylase (PgdA/CDA1 family)
LSFEEFVDMADKKKSLRGTALITFDDGFKSIYQDLYKSLKSTRTPFVIFVNSCVTNNTKLLWMQKLALILRAGRFNELFNALSSRKWLGCNYIINCSSPSFSDIRIPFIDYYDHYLYQELFDELLLNIGISEESEADGAGLFLTSDELWEMRDLCTLGNHTHSHINIATVLPDLLHRELSKCNEFIRQTAGSVAPIPFAVPFGPRHLLTDDAQKIIKQHCQFIFTAYGFGNLHAKQSQFRRINGENPKIKDLDDIKPYVTGIQDRRHCLSEWVNMVIGK